MKSKLKKIGKIVMLLLGSSLLSIGTIESVDAGCEKGKYPSGDCVTENGITYCKYSTSTACSVPV
ncbi:hypothetical protein [Thermoflexibacter ruber]|uniref:Uncharacterized protein n=1 Tax=Thermoflexibacter ruber TaxID=1003 RepID=A0A1I2FW39_9BACT|nr:hypothetical protein [Thermoflexibacter ruber]SFF09048.1 hypothetical protein SAMN04488541_101579 [Thermoflexibacter ruber]